MDDIATRLRILRGSLSQQQFGDLTSLPQRKLSRLETGAAPLDLESTQKICNTLKISADWLLFGRGPMRLGETIEPSTTVGEQGPSCEPAGPPADAERLAALEDERRELSAENRQLHRDHAALLKEMADLRERVARLEEQAIAIQALSKGGAMDSAAPVSAPSAPSKSPNNERV